jgi:hypothetical protein
MTSPRPGPVAAVDDPHRAPATQAMVSAALLLPTVVAYFLRSVVIYQLDGGATSMFRGDVWNMGLTAATDAYFVAVVVMRARTAGGRVGAALIGLVATVLDLVTLGLVYYTDYGLVMQWIGNVGSGLALVLFVAGWGVARRRRRTWYVGLVPTFAIAVVVCLIYQLKWATELLGDLMLTWYVNWGCWVGAFVLGCLCCWAFDVRLRVDPRQPIAPTADRVAAR